MHTVWKAPWGLKAIVAFYALGVVAVATALFTNRAATGEQLALVHGLPILAGVPAILLTIVMGVLVIAGLRFMRPWGYWLTITYMGFLLVVPPLTVGVGRLSTFTNVAWPLFVVVYLLVKRHAFGVGLPSQRLTSAST
jgi:hypothetical protein